MGSLMAFYKFIIFYFMWGTIRTQYPTNEAELTVTAVENVNRQITISCGFAEFVGRPYWFIEGLTYNLSTETYPMIQTDGLYTIIIQSPNICQNNTIYQCITGRSFGRVTRLIVKKDPRNPSSTDPLCDLQSPVSTDPLFSINTETFHNDGVSCTFRVNYPENCLNQSTQIHLDVHNGSQPTKIIPLPCCNANSSFEIPRSNVLPSSDILSRNAVPLYLQLNDSMNCQTQNPCCSAFEDIKTELHYVQRNKTLIIPFPNDTHLCKFSKEIYNVFLVISSNCTIRLIDNFNYTKHNCLKNNNYSIKYNSSAGMIYFSNWNDIFNHTVIFFMCYKSIYRHYSSSHEILIGNDSFPEMDPVTTEKDKVTTEIYTVTTEMDPVTAGTVSPITSYPEATTDSSSTTLPPSSNQTIIIVVCVLVLLIAVVVVVLIIICIKECAHYHKRKPPIKEEPTHNDQFPFKEEPTCDENAV